MQHEINPYHKLREDLKGKYPAVAEIVGCDSSYISLVLNGKRKSDKVVKACLSYAKKLKSEVENLQAELISYNEEPS